MADAKVLDSFALLAYFGDEPGAEAVQSLLIDAEKGRVRLLMPTVNLGEVWYAIARSESAVLADRLIAEVRAMPIEFFDADWALTLAAARIKATGGLSYADCFVAALAKLHKAEVVTGDPEFKRAEKDVTVSWLTKRA